MCSAASENASPKFPAKLLREENRAIFFEGTLGKDPFLFTFKATRRQTITAPRHHLTGLRVNWEWGLHGFGFRVEVVGPGLFGKNSDAQ